MVSAFLTLPAITNDVGFLHCKLGLRKTAVCLQVVLLNRQETDRLLEIGPEAFDAYLYPETERPHYLCQRHRTPLF